MGLLERMRKQDAVYWAPTTYDAFGAPLHADPTALLVRWEDTQEQYVDATGTTRVSRAKVYVGEDLELGGLIMLGDISIAQDSGFPADPRSYEGVLEIRSFTKIPNRKATKFLRQVFV
jgi:hypothetical protein